MQAAGAQMQLRHQARGLSVDELLHQRGRALHCLAAAEKSGLNFGLYLSTQTARTRAKDLF